MSQPQQPFNLPPQQHSTTGPTGQLVLNLRKPWGSMGMITPAASIDGLPATVTWGRNVFTVPAGSHQVEVNVSYLWQYGKASDHVPVSPGHQVEVHYSPPWFTMISGRMGPTQQPFRGTVLIGILLGLVALVLLLVLVVVIIAAFS